MIFLLARDGVGADNRGWVQLHVSTGGVAQKGDQKFEVTAGDIAAFADYIRSNPDRIPIDYDHSFDKSGVSRAAGWVDASTVEVRNGDELWAIADWTPTAAQQIRDGEYRYISPEFTFKAKKDGVLRGAAKFLAATLTNRPFLQNMAPVRLDDSVTDPEGDTMSKILATTLGLAEDADEKTIIAAITKRDEDAKAAAEAATKTTEDAKAALVAAQAELDALKATASDGDKKVTALETQVAALIKADHERNRQIVLDEAIRGEKMLPAERDAMVALYDKAGHDAVVALLEARPKIELNTGKGSAGEGLTGGVALTAKVDGQDIPIDPESAELNEKVQAHLRSLNLDHEPTQDEYLRALRVVTSA